MWTLNVLSKQEENNYFKEAFAFIEDIVKTKKRLSKKSKKILDNSILKDILIGHPNELYKLSDKIVSMFFGSSEQFEEYITAKKKLNKKHKEKYILKKFKDYTELIDIFDYGKFMNKNRAYKLAEILNISVCPYCNRQYIFTVEDKNRKITRPQFDHYLPKSIYPFLAISLYNLIPSCGICNLLKKDKSIKKIEGVSNCKDITMNPYMNIEEKKNLFRFSYFPNEYGYPKKIKINCENKKYQQKTELFVKTFEIKNIYNAHVNIEIKDLYDFATKYPKSYLQNLLEQIKLNFRISQEEAYRFLFGTEFSSINDNKRPLSKLKRDILEELDIIKPNK